MTIWKLSGIVLLGAALSACTTTPGTPGTAQVAVSYEDQVTCKTVVRTGTRLGTRQCMSNRAWGSQRAIAREAVEEIQQRSAHSQTIQGN